MKSIDSKYLPYYYIQTEVSQKAYLHTSGDKTDINDMVKFVFQNIWFREIIEFDGHYILKFKASLQQDVLDLTKKYFSKTMEEKYKNKEKKEVILNPFERHQIQVYKCQECGKEIILDNELMEQLNVYQGRDITEENFENENPQVLEFMDMQISEQTFGKRLLSIHNIRFLIKMMEDARKAIQEDRFGDFKKEMIEKYGSKKGF